MAEHLVAGALGGFVATALMTALMLSMMRDQPLPTQVFAAKLGERPAAAYRGWGLFLHFLYGTAMGVAFTALIEGLIDPVAAYSTGKLVQLGLLWGLALWVVFLLWALVLGILREARAAEGGEKALRMLGPIAAHLLYGIVLAGVVAKFIDTLPPGTL